MIISIRNILIIKISYGVAESWEVFVIQRQQHHNEFRGKRKQVTDQLLPVESENSHILKTV